LLVEDNPDTRELIETYVHRTGASIDCASNGRQGVAMATARDYDLIFFDMQMPDRDAVGAIKLLRNNGYSNPVVSLTANAELPNREQCFSAGADDYLVKPLNLSFLCDTLNKYLDDAEAVDSADTKPAVEVRRQSEAFYSSPRYQAIVERFKTRLPALFNELTAAVREKNWDMVQSRSHDLKGMGGTLGFAEITEVAAKMNQLVKEKDYDSVLQAHAELEDQCLSILGGSQ
jgi:CheY-like chemotaxis protein/HPt (histidine-containing phosphotransfer) domain-containing protein